MKKILTIIALLGAVIIIGYSNKTTQQTVDETQEVLGQPIQSESSNIINVSYNSQSYDIVSIKVADTNSLSLHSNLLNAQSALDLFQSSDCTALVNAGFYTPENTPLGYLATSDGTVTAPRENSLFNGFISINGVGTPRITNNLPVDTIIGVQSGPILYNNSFIQNLSIANDKEARRMIAITTGNNELIFLGIYKPNSMFSGPLLGDLPEIVNAWQKTSGINVADAINLDGGTHSAFITKDIRITEALPIGSYFCLK